MLSLWVYSPEFVSSICAEISFHMPYSNIRYFSGFIREELNHDYDICKIKQADFQTDYIIKKRMIQNLH